MPSEIDTSFFNQPAAYDWGQHEMGFIGRVYFQSARKCGMHSHVRLDDTRTECDSTAAFVHSAR